MDLFAVWRCHSTDGNIHKLHVHASPFLQHLSSLMLREPKLMTTKAGKAVILPAALCMLSVQALMHLAMTNHLHATCSCSHRKKAL